MKEQIKSQIEKWLDEKGYELRVRNYSQIQISEEQIISDLATRLDKAIGIDNIFLSKEELLQAIPTETKYIKSFFPECTCEYDTMGECLCYDWNKEFNDYKKAIVDSIFQTQKEKAITQSRPLKCEVEEKWNENVEKCSECGIEWKKIGKSCPVCFAPAEKKLV